MLLFLQINQSIGVDGANKLKMNELRGMRINLDWIRLKIIATQVKISVQLRKYDQLSWKLVDFRFAIILS